MDPLRIAGPTGQSGIPFATSRMNSSSYPKTRGLPLSSPSTTELKRQRAKLAFYELPITSFDRPVENDPREAALKRRQERLLASCEDKRKMTRTKKHKNATRRPHKDGFLVRLAHRLRLLCAGSLRLTKMGGGSKTPPHSGLSDDLHRALDSSMSPGGVDLDENARFRLQLAGLRIHGVHTTSHQHVLTL